MKTHLVKQNTPDWSALRLGKVTASEADALVTPEGKVRVGAGPLAYLYRKVAEKALGFTMNDGSSFAMEQGVIGELEAIPWFEFTHDLKVERAGFCTDDTEAYGFSPDGLIGEDGGIEVKTPQPHTHLQYLLEGVLPKDYAVQIQFALFVSQRKWWKFLSYSRQFPPLLLHVEPDERIQAGIKSALDQFLPLFRSKLAQITALKTAENAKRAGN